MSINYGPEVTFTAKLKTPCDVCDSRFAEWNGYDGIFECATCCTEVDSENVESPE